MYFLWRAVALSTFGSHQACVAFAREGESSIAPVGFKIASYNSVMARGWESKSVELQMDAAREKPPSAPNLPLTDQQKTLRQQRENLLMARSDVLHRIESSTNPRYSELLRQALKDLDAKIASLSSHIL